MQNLINELMAPSLDAQGQPLPVAAVKRRAALAIQQLYQQGQADLHARLTLEKRFGFEPITLDNALEIYRAATSQEYANEQT